MLRITRRDFLKYCSVAAGALGLSAGTMMKLDNVLAKTVDINGNSLPVVWISGAACTGCTISLANSAFYTTVQDLLINRIDLRYLDTLMASAGAQVNTAQWDGANSVNEARYVFDHLPYILAVEGAIPTGKPIGGEPGDYCRVGDLVPAAITATATVGGEASSSESMFNVTRQFAANANCLAILAIGTCSSFGGIPGARGNATDARGLMYRGTQARKGVLNDPLFGTAIDKPVINISGCPPHPDWIVGTIAHVLDTLGSSISDVLQGDYTAVLNALPAKTSYMRPVDYGYGAYQCNAGPCPWRYNNTSDTSGGRTIDNLEANNRYPVGDSRGLGRNKWKNFGNDTNLGCLGILGCKGRKTKADCSRRRWNTDVAEEYGVNWCVGNRGGCQGCTEPTFPDKVGKFYTFA